MTARRTKDEIKRSKEKLFNLLERMEQENRENGITEETLRKVHAAIEEDKVNDILRC